MVRQNSRKQVVITRPEPMAVETEKRLNAMGIETLLLPMHKVEALPLAPHETAEIDDIDDTDDTGPALIVTSLNGVAFGLQRSTVERSIPVYAVGDKTAEAARKLGFREVHSAAGNAHDLVALIKKQATTIEQFIQYNFIHYTGGTLPRADDHRQFASTTALNINDALAEVGISVKTVMCYGLVRSPHKLQEYDFDSYNHVLFYAASALQQFETLARQAEIPHILKGMTAYCLSERIKEASDAEWNSIKCAAEPTESALLALLNQS